VESVEKAFPHIRRLRITFDGLIPSAFRSVTAKVPAEWDESGIRLRPPLDNLMSAARAVLQSSNPAVRRVGLDFFAEAPMFAAIPVAAMSGVTLARDLPQFHPGTNILRSHLRLVSLAQHYEHQSAMVDVTRSPDVAAWFASHRWTDGATTTAMGGAGAIYRFDSQALASMVADRILWKEGTPPFVQGLGLLGLVDISRTDPRTAARPAAQAGGSILGLENSAVYFLMRAYSVAEVFTFPHSSVRGSEVTFSKKDLCPDSDPAGDIVWVDDKQPPPTPEELSAMLQAAGMARGEAEHVAALRSAELL
jgi:hypothetical protein